MSTKRLSDKYNKKLSERKRIGGNHQAKDHEFKITLGADNEPKKPTNTTSNALRNILKKTPLKKPTTPFKTSVKNSVSKLAKLGKSIASVFSSSPLISSAKKRATKKPVVIEVKKKEASPKKKLPVVTKPTVEKATANATSISNTKASNTTTTAVTNSSSSTNTSAIPPRRSRERVSGRKIKIDKAVVYAEAKAMEKEGLLLKK